MDQVTRIGNVKRETFGSLGEKAARAIMRSGRAKSMAVTLGPCGLVEVDVYADAVPDDLVGCYDPDSFALPRWLYLGKRISEDLRHAWQLLQREVA